MNEAIDLVWDHEWEIAIFGRTEHRHAKNMLVWRYPRFRQSPVNFVSSGEREEPIVRAPRTFEGKQS